MKRRIPSLRVEPPTVYSNAIDNVNLKPKLKKPDIELTAESAPQEQTPELKLLRRMMGFREWCEKVYDRREILVDDETPPAAK